MAEHRKSWLVAVIEVAGAIAVTLMSTDPGLLGRLRPSYLHAVMRAYQRAAAAAGRVALQLGAAGIDAEARYRREVGQ